MVGFVNEAGTTVATPAPAHQEPSVRDAHVVLDHNRYSWIWVVPTCPFCGKSHDHYAGPLDGNPRAYLGMRYAAHCDEGDRRRLLAQLPAEQLWYVLVASRRVPAATARPADQLAI